MVHRRGIIHRDIKPRNILIDEAGEPRLIDFGLARLRHAWSDRPDPTWGGTLAYMAPEQARLEHDRIGPRSDVFGLGAVLYFLLTGQPPFVGETTDEVWDRAKRCEFEKDALRLAKVPRRLGRICLTALAADPAGAIPRPRPSKRHSSSISSGQRYSACCRACALLRWPDLWFSTTCGPGRTPPLRKAPPW